MAETTSATSTGATSTTETTAATSTATETTTAGTATETTSQQEDTVLSTEAIQKLIQSTVDKKTAEFGKTIAELKKENNALKKANMTAEEIQKAEREEFENQKAEVALQKRQIFAHRAVATAGYGDNADAVVDIILGDTDEKTEERLKNFKALVDKLVAETVDKTFKANGRVPNGAGQNGTGESKKENSIAEQLGQTRAEQQKKANDVLSHYLGG